MYTEKSQYLIRYKNYSSMSLVLFTLCVAHTIVSSHKYLKNLNLAFFLNSDLKSRYCFNTEYFSHIKQNSKLEI